MGLGFGGLIFFYSDKYNSGLIAFGSYNPLKNNCKRDVTRLALANVATSLYTAVVIFCVLGYMGRNNMTVCIEKDMQIMADLFPEVFHNSVDEVKSMFTRDQYIDVGKNVSSLHSN